MAKTLMEELDAITNGVKDVLKQAQQREAAFAEWYGKLTKSAPALDRDQVTLTRENFKKAMRQAYRAGSALDNAKAEPRRGAKL